MGNWDISKCFRGDGTFLLSGKRDILCSGRRDTLFSGKREILSSGNREKGNRFLTIYKYIGAATSMYYLSMAATVWRHIM